MEEFLKSLDKLETLSNTALTFCACIVFGYVLRFIKKFPNDGIPLAVVLNGAGVYLLLVLSDQKNIPPQFNWFWAARFMTVGSLVGFVAWMSHKLVVSRLEDWLSQRFDVVNRVLNGKPSVSAPTETKDEKTNVGP